MKLNLLYERILKFSFNIWRINFNHFDSFCQKFDIAPQTVKNALCDLHNLGLLKRRRVGRHYKYKTSDRGKEKLLLISDIKRFIENEDKEQKDLFMFFKGDGFQKKVSVSKLN